MVLNPALAKQLEQVAERLHRAQEPSSDLFQLVIDQACLRLPAFSGSVKRQRLDQLIEAGAWIDAALQLAQLERPDWKLRRLIFDDGDWICSLSSAPLLPVTLDEMAECSHPDPALAILGAVVEASRMRALYRAGTCRSVPAIRSGPDAFVVCSQGFD
jgi:hypothetical protein